MAVCIKRDRYAVAPYQSLEELEVAASVLQFAEQRIDHDPSSIVHRQQQCELRYILSKPSVITAVHLQEHTLGRQPLPSNTVLRRPTTTRTVHTGVSQYLAQRVATDVYALPLSQQLAQVRVVDSGVSGVRQTYCFDIALVDLAYKMVGMENMGDVTEESDEGEIQ